MSSLLDIVVGQLSLRQGLVTSEQLQDCVVEQLRPPHPPLGQVLVRRRLVSPTQLLRLMQAAEGTRLACSRCRALFPYRRLDPTREPLCPGCGGVLDLQGSDPARGPRGHQGTQLHLTRPDTATGSVRRTTRRDSASTGRFRPGLSDMGNAFGPYEILEELGRGGMGVVYKVRDPRRKGYVALKILLGGEMASRHQIARFRREAEIASRLEHPNIVRIHDVGVEGDYYYFTMDLVEGHPLSQLIKRRQLGQRRAAELTRDVALGLFHAHEAEVIHRDIKPDNIIVDLAGAPIITDFGLAKELDPELAARLTRSGALVGTPFYMSPEQASGKGNQVGAAADIYALGVVLFEMLTGELPFSADTQIELTSKIVNDAPPSPTDFEPVDRDLETIVLKTLSKSPADRYATAQDLAGDLDRYLRSEPIRARRRNILTRLWRSSRRKRTTLIMGVCGAVVVVLSTLAVARALQLIGEREDEDLASQQQQQQQLLLQQQRAAAEEALRQEAADAVDAADEALRFARHTPAGESYRGALDSAVRRISQALTHPLNREDSRLLLARARVQCRLRREEQAMADLERVRRLDREGPRGAEASYLIARNHLRLEHGEEARGVLQAQRDVDRGEQRAASPWRGLCEAMQLYLDEDFEGALKVVTPLRERNPLITEAYQLEATSLMRVKRGQEALRLLEKASEVESKDAVLWANLAQLRVLVNPARGKEDVRRALELDPDNAMALKLRAAISKDEGEVERGIVDLRQVLDKHPNDLDVLLTLALYYNEARQGTLSEQMLKRIERAAPLDQRPYEFRAMAYLFEGDFERAASELRHGMTVVFQDAKASERLLKLFKGVVLETRRLSAGEEWVQERLAQRPEDPDVLTFQVEIHIAAERYAEAKELLAQIRDKHPDHRPSWQLELRLAKSLFEWSPERLEAELQRYAASTSEDAPGMAWLGKFCVMILGDVDRAEEYGKRAIEIDSKNAQAMVVLALVAGRSGAWRDARRLLMEAVSVDSNDSDALAMLGAVEFNLGNPRRAESYLRAVLATEPFRINALEGLTLCLLKTGRSRECVIVCEQHVELSQEAGRSPHPLILEKLIAAQLNLNKAEELFTFLATLAKRYPGDPVFRVLLAQALAKDDKIIEARKELAEILAEHPDNALAEELQKKLESADED